MGGWRPWPVSSMTSRRREEVGFDAAMGLILTATAGLCIWIVVWALNVSGLDAIFFAIGMVLIAIGVRNLLPFLPGRRGCRRAAARRLWCLLVVLRQLRGDRLGQPAGDRRLPAAR